MRDTTYTIRGHSGPVHVPWIAPGGQPYMQQDASVDTPDDTINTLFGATGRNVPREYRELSWEARKAVVQEALDSGGGPFDVVDCAETAIYRYHRQVEEKGAVVGRAAGAEENASENTETSIVPWADSDEIDLTDSPLLDPELSEGVDDDLAYALDAVGKYQAWFAHDPTPAEAEIIEIDYFFTLGDTTRIRVRFKPPIGSEITRHFDMPTPASTPDDNDFMRLMQQVSETLDGDSIGFGNISQMVGKSIPMYYKERSDKLDVETRAAPKTNNDGFGQEPQQREEIGSNSDKQALISRFDDWNTASRAALVALGMAGVMLALFAVGLIGLLSLYAGFAVVASFQLAAAWRGLR